MKVIKYQIATEIKTGAEESSEVQNLFQGKTMPYSEENEAIAKQEAYNGEYEIYDDGQPEPAPTESEQLRSDVDELREALDLLLSGGDGMKPELKEKIIKYNRTPEENKEKADDFMTVLGALPPGQVKNLLKDSTIGPILEKYGIKGE